MRQDQFEALQQRAESLLDLFLQEANPAKWPGHGIEPRNMDKGTRGDRVWCKRDAAMTLACVHRITTLVSVVRQKSAGGETDPDAVTDPEDELNREVAAAEKEAALAAERLTRQAQARARATTHGGP